MDGRVDGWQFRSRSHPPRPFLADWLRSPIARLPSASLDSLGHPFPQPIPPPFPSRSSSTARPFQMAISDGCWAPQSSPPDHHQQKTDRPIDDYSALRRRPTPSSAVEWGQNFHTIRGLSKNKTGGFLRVTIKANKSNGMDDRLLTAFHQHQLRQEMALCDKDGSGE